MRSSNHPHKKDEWRVARCLDKRNFRFVEEPLLGGKRPDFGVLGSADNIVAAIEVETMTSSPFVEDQVVTVDTVSAIRDQIDHARNHFKGCKDIPCLLVICDFDTMHLTRPSEVAEAMLGSAALGVGLGADGSRRMGMVLADDGKVKRPRWRKAQNTTVSAVAVIRRLDVCCQLAIEHFESDRLVLKKLPGGMQAALVADGGPVPSEVEPNKTLVAEVEHLRIVRNPYARLPWPDELIGDWDDVYEPTGSPIDIVRCIRCGSTNHGVPASCRNYGRDD